MKEEEMESFIRRSFEENFVRLRFENGHGLTAEVKEAALRHVLLYWRKLRKIAETVTDTEVRLNLPGQVTPNKRKFNIEGIVDIVRAEGRTVMYDIKTLDPRYVMNARLVNTVAGSSPQYPQNMHLSKYLTDKAIPSSTLNFASTPSAPT